MWQNFQKALEQRVGSGKGKSKSRKKRVDKYIIEMACRKVIVSQFGKTGEAQVFFEKFKNNRVELKCKKSVWKSEIRIRKKELTKKINDELKDKMVLDIVIY